MCWSLMSDDFNRKYKKHKNIATTDICGVQNRV